MFIDSPYRVVLADDQTMFRRDLMRILNAKCDLEIVGEAGDGAELLDLLNMIKLAPHLAIVDISMPNIGGIDVTSRIKKTYPDMKVLILSTHREKEYIHEAFSAGADGYLLKQEVSTELFSAINKIRDGRIFVSPLITEMEKF